ncbi:alpha/beta hydrolase [Pseudonocardia ailaonensis]|uniref:Alpha/beta hydrolase n=1 Tax=Pseudonocardia ailaonensis TaxID=367279 RepID=A0ABN2N5G6_9PSEU
MTTFTSHDGLRLRYRTIGSGPPLLVVPGGPRASSYLGDLGGLAEHRTLVLYDARGTGGSDAPDPAEREAAAYPALAQDVHTLRRHLGLERVDVLGHSAGTVVAQAAAAADPGAFTSLTLVTPGGDLFGVPPTDIGEVLAGRAEEPWFDQAKAALTALFSLGPDAPAEQVAAALLDYAPAAYGHWEAPAKEHVARQQAEFALTAWQGFWGAGPPANPVLVDRLRTLTLPVLVLTGSRDALSGVAIGDHVAAVYPDAVHRTIPGAGHYPWVDEPARFVEAITS